MATNCAMLMNQYKFIFQTVFSARFDKQGKDGQILDETEIYKNLGINRSLKRIEIDNINVRFQLEDQIITRQMKDIGWRFDKCVPMTVYFFKNYSNEMLK